MPHYYCYYCYLYDSNTNNNNNNVRRKTKRKRKGRRRFRIQDYKTLSSINAGNNGNLSFAGAKIHTVQIGKPQMHIKDT